MFNDVVYAFRDNVGATAGDMYKSTASGWSQVTFGNEFTFSTGRTGSDSRADHQGRDKLAQPVL